jgi:hypothetical protein
MDKKDPIERNPKFKEILAQAEAAAWKELKALYGDETNSLGFVHVFWDTKKRILKETYDVDWKSPAEMNPHIEYD